jgi:predicted DNA-binding transcriptional regulator AlpA
VLDAWNERPALPALVSAPEAAELLGVSAQRVHELATDHATFPEAV